MESVILQLRTAFNPSKNGRWLIIALFFVAVYGTFRLSEEISERGAASVFFSNDMHEVSLYSGYADPVWIEAVPGEEIVFTVKDDSRHNIAEATKRRGDARLESGELGPGDSYSLVFQGTGEFSFYDRLDQDIRVTVLIR